MRTKQYDVCGRSMRWYDWLAALLLLGLIGGVRAESVYKCTDDADSIIYQGQPCSESQHQHEISIAPAPPVARSPEYAVHDEHTVHAAASSRQPHRAPAHDVPVSYECRVSNGEVFYRHSPCPHSLQGESEPHGAKKNSAGKAGSSHGLTVSSRVVTREEACSQMHRAGAIGRNGRARDDDVSTYERNLGHDPCK
jgi:Domain of unknown function (DUF4124)